MRWHIVAKQCLPCVVVLASALAVAGCVSPEIAEAIKEIVDAVAVPVPVPAP